MKVGEYVRTNDGCICKVLEYTDISDNDYYVNTDSPYNVIYKSWIVKSSPNIIDLIEVGDYVNGYLVTTGNQDVGSIYISEIDGLGLKKKLYEKDIKSIVTHEQFSQMEYRIGE